MAKADEVKKQEEQAKNPSVEEASITNQEAGLPHTVVNANINTANGAGSQITEAQMKRDVETAARVLNTKKKKSVSIPKQLAGVLGETLPACINGACIVVPVDGEEHEVPEPYYNIVKNALKTINSGDVRADLQAGANDDYLKA